jgi:hypothetical protein
MVPGLPDGTCIFKTKNPNLGKFWRALECNRLVYYMALLYGDLLQFGIFSFVLVYCVRKNLATLDGCAKFVTVARFFLYRMRHEKFE